MALDFILIQVRMSGPLHAVAKLGRDERTNSTTAMIGSDRALFEAVRPCDESRDHGPVITDLANQLSRRGRCCAEQPARCDIFDYLQILIVDEAIDAITTAHGCLSPGEAISRSSSLRRAADSRLRVQFRTDLHPQLAEHVQAVSVRPPTPEVVTPTVLDERAIARRDQFPAHLLVLLDLGPQDLSHDVDLHFVPVWAASVECLA